MGNIQSGFKAAAFLSFTGYSFLQSVQLCFDNDIGNGAFPKGKVEE